MRDMQNEAWWNQDDQFQPGRELFRQDRTFSLWAYTVTHGQLLLRPRTVAADGGRQSGIDALFKPVEGVKTRIDHKDLVIRCATVEERERILDDTGNRARNHRVFILETVDEETAGLVGAVDLGATDGRTGPLGGPVRATRLGHGRLGAWPCRSTPASSPPTSPASPRRHGRSTAPTGSTST